MGPWIALVLSMALLSGCSTAPVRPSWIDGDAGLTYPATRYLVGRGQGDTAALARDRARADLVKVFETHIQEQSEDVTEATRSWSGDGSSIQAESQVRRVLSTSSNHVIEGIMIADAWVGEGGDHHAMAVLDRNSAGARLRERIEELDQATERLITAAGQASDPLRRVELAGAAVANQRERSAQQRYFRVIDVAGIGVPARYGVDRLTRDRKALAARIGFAVRGEGDEAQAVERLLATALTEAGYRQVALPAADYLLTAEAIISESRAEGWFWARGAVRVDLYDRNAVMRRSERWPIKAAAIDGTSARQRALVEAGSRIRDGLAGLLLGADAPPPQDR